MIVAWTGHRPDLFEDVGIAHTAVMDAARDLLLHEPLERFLVGGQRGVDTWAAEAAIELGLQFTLILPFDVADFTVDWTATDRTRLLESVQRADQVRIAGGYRERNRALATEGDLLIAVWTGRLGGGTAETVGFARDFGTPVREVRLRAAPSTGPAAGRGI
ncbi:MAG TPA: SLOG family protein [Chloroflexota bacterium]|jgi:hypothetical protein